MTRSIFIAGLGNSFAGDDGAGVVVIERLRLARLPHGVRVDVAGTDSLRLCDLWRGEDEVWLVDAVRKGGPAGAIHLLRHEQILALPQRHATAHRMSLPENLRWMRLARPEMRQVRFRLWGIEVAELEPAGRLTPAVARAAERLAEQIRLAAIGPGVSQVS